MAKLALLLTICLLAAPCAALAGQHRQAALPIRGVLVSGQSLGGVTLGDTPADVESAWGSDYTTCRTCTLTTWYFTYPTRPVGAAVIFDRTNHAAAVFTLGTPFGWRTEKGLQLGEEIHTLTAMYPAPKMDWKGCMGSSALSLRQGSIGTSRYT